MHWFDPKRIPVGTWPFLSTARVGLVDLEAKLTDEMDFTEGTGQLLVTGEMEGYRHAIVRRVIDLAQAVALNWNAGLLAGAVVCSRSLLETLAIFHSFLTRAQEFAAALDWLAIRELLLDYVAFSSEAAPSLRKKPPQIGAAVKAFIRTVEPGAERFWGQICDIAHPNGRRMVWLYGVVDGQVYRERAQGEIEAEVFQAIFNVVHSCCWLVLADLEFEILLEEFRAGGPLSADHRLMQERIQIEQMTAEALAGSGTSNPWHT